MIPQPRSGEQLHPHEELIDPWTKTKVIVDRSMTDLIRQLWRHGIRTRFCCQGEPGELAYVTVHDAPDAQRLVALLADRYGVQMGVSCSADRPAGSISRHRRWRWEVRPRSDAGTWRLSLALFLPLEDVEGVTQHLAGCALCWV